MLKSQLILSPEDRRHVGVLVHAALDQLWMASPDAAPDGEDTTDLDGDYRGCCTHCCGPCHTLFDLMKSGQLDIWVRFWPENLNGTSWWDAERSRVDRSWLDRAWANEDRLGCHD